MSTIKRANNRLLRTIIDQSLKNDLRKRFCRTALWTPVVGLEVHAQIASTSKLFSSADSNFFAPLNTVVSFFDCALPGTLPVLNRRCVEAAIMAAFTLNCNVNLVSRFDRKHYFYADLPTGYQITQHSEPIAQNGTIEYYVYNKKSGEPFKKATNIKQIQLEQDSGKTYTDSTHNRSLIDLNRAGCGLIEIVFDHNLSSGLEASCLIRELSALLKAAGICECKMEKGHLRVDANVSVHMTDGALGVKTEVKNLNSVRFIQTAIDYEIKRQIELLEKGDKVVNETRSYDFRTGTTLPMRDKEVRQDYRYMPEPNLPPLRLYSKSNPVPANVDQLSIIDIDKIRDNLPNTLERRRKKWLDEYGVSLTDMVMLEEEPKKAEYFEQCLSYSDRDVGLIAKALVDSGSKFGAISQIRPTTYAELCLLLKRDLITEFTFERLLSSYADKSSNGSAKPNEIVSDRNLWRITDPEVLENACDQVLADHVKIAKDYQRGKKRMMNRLTVIADKMLGGRAHVDELEQIFVRKLQCK